MRIETNETNGQTSTLNIDDAILVEAANQFWKPIIELCKFLVMTILIGLCIFTTTLTALNFYNYYYGNNKLVTVSMDGQLRTYRSAGGVVYLPKGIYTFINQQNNKKTTVSGNVIIESIDNNTKE